MINKYVNKKEFWFMNKLQEMRWTERGQKERKIIDYVFI